MSASTPALLVRHVRAQNKIFWRVPIGAFFALVLPVVMLVLFVALFGGNEFTTEYGFVSRAQFYTPALAVFSAASATYTNLGINLSIRRDEGILRRVRGTPLPPWIYLAGVVGSGVFVALLGTVFMTALGVVAYGVNIELAKLPAMIVTFVVGSATFSILGVALASLASSAAAAPALANATLLPVAFVSNVFISFEGEAPRWLTFVGDLFPLRHFALAYGEAMSPFSDPPALAWDRLGVIALWGVVGALIAWRKFSWEPAVGARTTRGRRGSRRR
ncbi:MAG: ABC transporter permease [Acidimicrobiales bacterium]